MHAKATLYIILLNRIDKPGKSCKKPNFMIGTKIKAKEVYFFVEVKKTSGHKQVPAERRSHETHEADERFC
ncbi:hypothetical protein AB4K20DRAFT_1906802 [Rhizopus microsporus]